MGANVSQQEVVSDIENNIESKCTELSVAASSIGNVKIDADNATFTNRCTVNFDESAKATAFPPPSCAINQFQSAVNDASTKSQQFLKKLVFLEAQDSNQDIKIKTDQTMTAACNNDTLASATVKGTTLELVGAMCNDSTINSNITAVSLAGQKCSKLASMGPITGTTTFQDKSDPSKTTTQPNTKVCADARQFGCQLGLAQNAGDQATAQNTQRLIGVNPLTALEDFLLEPLIIAGAIAGSIIIIIIVIAVSTSVHGEHKNIGAKLHGGDSGVHTGIPLHGVDPKSVPRGVAVAPKPKSGGGGGGGVIKNIAGAVMRDPALLEAALV